MAPTTRGRRISEEDKLKAVMCNFAGEDAARWDANTSNLKAALYGDGIRTIKDLLILSDADLDDLQWTDAAGNVHKIVKHQRRLIRAIIACYHEYSRRKGEPISLSMLSRANFNAFVVNAYQYDKPIIPWSKAAETTTKEDREVEAWNKAMKPNMTSYKEFRDPTQWVTWKEHFVTTLESQGLGHMVDPSYIPSNEVLYRKQSEWMFKLLQEKCTDRTTREIILQHKDESPKDIIKLWTAICGENESSITSELRVSELATYLNSFRLASGAWRGSQLSFILHWKEQARQHNLLCTIDADKFTESQLVRMLNNALVGVDPLCNVLDNYRQNARAAGIFTTTSKKGVIRFEDYFALLKQAAQTHAGVTAVKRATTTSSRRTANVHDIVFDDSTETEDIQVNVHDIDTNVSDLIASQHKIHFGINQSDTTSRFPMSAPKPGYNQGNNRTNPGEKRVVMLNRDTWNSMKPEDKAAWDKLSPDGKQKVLNYAMNKAKEINSSRQANFHEVDAPQDDELQFDEDAPSIEANVHEVASKPDDSSDKESSSGNGESKNVEGPTVNGESKYGYYPEPYDVSMARILSNNVSTNTRSTKASVSNIEINVHNVDFSKIMTADDEEEYYRQFEDDDEDDEMLEVESEPEQVSKPTSTKTQAHTPVDNIKSTPSGKNMSSIVKSSNTYKSESYVKSDELVTAEEEDMLYEMEDSSLTESSQSEVKARNLDKKLAAVPDSKVPAKIKASSTAVVKKMGSAYKQAPSMGKPSTAPKMPQDVDPELDQAIAESLAVSEVDSRKQLDQALAESLETSTVKRSEEFLALSALDIPTVEDEMEVDGDDFIQPIVEELPALQDVSEQDLQVSSDDKINKMSGRFSQVDKPPKPVYVPRVDPKGSQTGMDILEYLYSQRDSNTPKSRVDPPESPRSENSDFDEESDEGKGGEGNDDTPVYAEEPKEAERVTNDKVSTVEESTLKVNDATTYEELDTAVQKSLSIDDTDKQPVKKSDSSESEEPSMEDIDLASNSKNNIPSETTPHDDGQGEFTPVATRGMRNRNRKAKDPPRQQTMRGRTGKKKSNNSQGTFNKICSVFSPGFPPPPKQSSSEDSEDSTTSKGSKDFRKADGA